MIDETNMPIEQIPTETPSAEWWTELDDQGGEVSHIETTTVSPELTAEYDVVTHDLGAISVGEVEVEGQLHQPTLLGQRVAERFSEAVDVLAAHPKVAPINEGIGNVIGKDPSEIVKNRFTERIQTGVDSAINNHPSMKRIEKPAAKVVEVVTVDRARKAVELARAYNESQAA